MCLGSLQIASNKVTPLQAGGALMLGGEQDCYGGCTDAGQAFYGLMDEVRFWNGEGCQLLCLGIQASMSLSTLSGFWDI